MENSFKISGFVGFNEVKVFASSSVCRFSIAVSRTDKESNVRTSAFLNAETWAKNEDAEKFNTLAKGNLVTVEGYFKPEEWTDKDGKKNNRVVLVATKFTLNELNTTEKK